MTEPLEDPPLVPRIESPNQALVVADVSLIRWDICEQLRDEGILPIEASSAEEGIDLVDEFEFQVTLISLWASGNNGPALAKKLTERFRDLPVVVSCGHHLPSEYAGLKVIPVETYDTSAIVRTILKVMSCRENKLAD